MARPGLLVLIPILALTTTAFGQQRSGNQQLYQLEQAMRTHVQASQPAYIGALDSLKALDARAHRSMLESTLRDFRRMRRAKRNKAHGTDLLHRLFLLENQARLLALHYRLGDEQGRPALGERLRATVEQAFDLREQARQADLERLEKQLEELRSSLQKRSKNREKIIRRRIDVLTGADDVLRWE